MMTWLVLVLLGGIADSSAQTPFTPTIREYSLDFVLPTGEEKHFLLRVNPEPRTAPSHAISGTVVEDGSTCAFRVEFAPSDDQPGSIPTCSGLSIGFSSLRGLFAPGPNGIPATASLQAPGLHFPLAESRLRFERSFEAPRTIQERPLAPVADYLGPCH